MEHPSLLLLLAHLLGPCILTDGGTWCLPIPPCELLRFHPASREAPSSRPLWFRAAEQTDNHGAVLWLPHGRCLWSSLMLMAWLLLHAGLQVHDI